MQPELMGYPDRLSVSAGETIRFMISTDAESYDASIVRLIHADANPKGPGVKMQPVESAINKRWPGRKQIIHPGSYVIVEDNPALALTSFTAQCWIYPTRNSGLRTIISRGAQGFGLFLDDKNCLSLWLGDGQSLPISTGEPLHLHVWYFVAASYDAQSGKATLYQSSVMPFAHPDFDPLVIEQSANPPVATTAPLLIAAAAPGDQIFNGKIDHPRLFSRALSSKEIDQLRSGADPASISGVVADWDFAADVSSQKVTDRSANKLNGTAVNMPARGVTGYNWTNTEVNWRYALPEYGAIHFHDDDLDDARWQPDFELTIPADWKSGIYALQLKAGDQIDEIPFVVRPAKGKPSAPILYLLPTMTYLAYANIKEGEPAIDENGQPRQVTHQPLSIYQQEHPEIAMSIYDFHSDGSGCSYSSRKRPIPNMHPRFSWDMINGPRHFAADLYLEDWLDAKGFAHDVVIDEDLHFGGYDLLKSYKVVMTGTHPEYWTTPMMDALRTYLDNGGHLMYLGGNGFYWITSVDPERPHVVEVKRGNNGTRAWNSAPGETYHSTTGELGGLWRERGRAPNTVAGIGFTAQGWDGRAGYYERKEGSFDPRAAFIFEGVGADELIGNFGLGLGGAAGDELDCVDETLGTPPHTLLLASSTGHAPSIMPVIEDFLLLGRHFMERVGWRVRSDLAYLETPNGGAVFSVGSIDWCNALSYNHYQNNVSRITENVLREFTR